MMDFTENDLRLYAPKMMGAVRQAKRNNKEHGFVVCMNRDKGTFRDTPICVGEKCEIALPKCDEIGESTAMRFHTHPKSQGTSLSDGDLATAIREWSKFECIGNAAGDGTITCWQILDPQTDEDFETLKIFTNAHTNQDLAKTAKLMAEAEYLGQNNLFRKAKRWENFIRNPF